MMNEKELTSALKDAIKAGMERSAKEKSAKIVDELEREKLLATERQRLEHVLRSF